MQSIPKKTHQFSLNDLPTLDEKYGLLSAQPEPSEQIKFIQKGVRPVSDTALDLVKSGTNLLSIPPTDRSIEDAQFLYSTQLFNDVLMKSLSSVQVPDAYDNLNAQIREYDKQELLKQEEFL